ncbi:QueT transporter family protein [Caldisalinibacter kiritimatiensis]|uniref:Substrate-specific component QueT of predicted queuosine-regulated ECF transporter n=1 Tax=Caldisalinibacter kiritimatiensis TaxID=1304284 RepID=R1CCV7_9FIRM|nr:QueT transporter family protein [Caldisalinibacter kiritimatiensis]EOD00125.1 Substrate-specific component QueT of predicted queuosine-regulated ECF transporter [Caldisalinibacter kiritimatiensis]
MNTRYLSKSAAIAALYVILVALEIPLGTLAFGPVQIRVAEALVLLPLIESAAIPGVFIGCLLANTILTFTSGFGLIDIVGGSLVTLIAAYLTSKMPNKILGVIPPVALNGLIVSIWVAKFTNFPYWPTVGFIALGELIAVGLFGSIVLYAYERIKDRI